MAESLLTDIDSPASIPSGTVTFLFTDIQGSTQLLERLREQYALVLAEQRDVLRAIFAEWNGHEIDTQGDAFFVAFPRALDAVNCAIQAQRALAAHTWPQNVRVYVRMGLHTGEPIIARTGYVGMDVHLAARIGAAGHGGQILLSKTTRELVYADLPHGVSLRDLGEHKLKDIRHPQKIYQVEIEGLNVEFPSLKTLATGEEPPTPGNPPFKGMQFFDEADADLFFGRETMTSQLIERIQAQRFLAIIGASGSGKSSVVRAGVVPLLKRQQAAHWHIHVITPTSHPLEALAASLTHGTESVTATSTLIDDLAHDQRSLHLYVRKSSPRARLLIVVDQFEELFTLCRNEAERQAFVDNLLYAQAADGTNATIVIVLRADFYEHLAQYAALREAVAKHQEYLGPMSAEELREAIEEPAKRGGWEFSPGLVDLMLHDVGATADHQPEPGALPLLSHALLETWRRRRGNVMTLKGYSESGGVRGAIARTAETVYYTELDAEQRLIARSIFLRLTELGEGTQDTRRRASLDELFPPASFATPAQVEEVVVKLADARLITTGEGTIEVAHEALIREWSTLREWLTHNREGLRLHRHLTEAAQEWELLERDPSALYRGIRLVQALEWAEANPRELNAQEQNFLDGSKELAMREETERKARQERELEAAQKLAETEKRAASNLRRRAVYLSGALIVAAVLAIVALIFGQQAQVNLQNSQTAEARAVDEAQSRATAQANAVAESQIRGTQQALAEANYTHAEAQRLANEANNLLLTGGNADQIALLSLRSMNLQYSPQGDIALTGASSLNYPIRIFIGNTGPINAVAISPDGRYMLTGGDDRTARLWDIQTGEQIRQLGTLYGSVLSLAFSPDGQLALIGRSDYNATLVAVKTGEFLRNFVNPCGTSVAFSDDGNTALMVGKPPCLHANTYDQDFTLWNIQTGQRLQKVFIGQNLQGGALSHDNRYVAAAQVNGQVSLWDLQTSQVIRTLAGHKSVVNTVVFSPDDKYLLSASSDSTSRLWDVQSGQVIHLFLGHTAEVNSVAFSPDGRFVATGSSDRTARLWDVQSGQLLHTFSGHTDSVSSVAISPDGKYLVTGSRDHTTRLWEVNPQSELPEFKGHSGEVDSVAFSPDGQSVLTGGGDHTARLWDVHIGRQLCTFVGHDDIVQTVAFSPDSQYALTGSADQTVRLWTVKTGEELRRFNIGSDLKLGTPINVTFSPDQQYAIAGFGMEPFIGRWSLDTGRFAGSLLPVSGIVGFSGPNPVKMSIFVFSPDGKLLLTADTKNIMTLYNIPQGTKVRQYRGNADLISEVAFSPNGLYALTGSLDKTARLYDIQTAQELRQFIGHTAGLHTVAYSPDGKSVATGSADGTARIWDVQTGQELRRFDFHAFVNQVKFSPEGKYLVIVGDNDGKFSLWDVDYHDTIRYLCNRLLRDLTDDERKQYGITDTSPTCPAKATP